MPLFFIYWQYQLHLKEINKFVFILMVNRIRDSSFSIMFFVFDELKMIIELIRVKDKGK